MAFTRTLGRTHPMAIAAVTSAATLAVHRRSSRSRTKRRTRMRYPLYPTPWGETRFFGSRNAGIRARALRSAREDSSENGALPLLLGRSFFAAVSLPLTRRNGTILLDRRQVVAP